MRAAVYHGPGDIRIEAAPKPIPRAGEVLVRVLRSGLCGTDITEWKRGPIMIPLHAPHPHSGHSGPMIPGHEIVGEIVTAPEGARLQAGMIVASGAQVFCGECPRCVEGRVNICERLYSLGLNVNGGHAEYTVGPVRSFVEVPPDLDIDYAGLAQPLSVGLHAARRSGAIAGDHVLVSGAGAIGSFLLAGLRHLIPDLHVTVTDVDPVKLKRALRLGADEAKEPSQAVNGALYDVAIEASGAPGALAACIRGTRAGGRVLAVGMPADSVELDMHDLVLREVTLHSTVALITDEDLVPAMQILSGTRLGRELFDSVRPLSDIAATLDSLANGEIQGKVLLDPSR